MLLEHPAISLRSLQHRWCLEQVVGGADRTVRAARRVQEVQLEILRQRRQTATPRTLLPRASSGGENTASRELAGQHREDAAATPLLAGKPTR